MAEAVNQSVLRACREWYSFKGPESIDFGDAKFEFTNFTPEITPVDLLKAGAEDLLAYINSIRRNEFFQPLQAMIFEVNGVARLMAVQYIFDRIKETTFLHNINPEAAGIFISGEKTSNLSRWIGGFQLGQSGPGAKKTVTIRDSGADTLTFNLE